MKTGITKWHGRQVFTLATEANVAAMKKAAAVVVKDVQANFTLQGTGHTVEGVWKPGVGVRRTKKGKMHYAAPPGKPPAIDYGTLRASIMKEVTQKGANVTGKVGPDIQKIAEGLKKAGKTGAGTDIEYGLYLELGTSKMQARPFLRPALVRTRKQIKKIFKDANS